MKLIVWNTPSGGVALTEPCEPMLEGETEEAYLDRIAQKFLDHNPGCGYTRAGSVEPSVIPANRSSRKLWKWNGQTIV